MNNQALTQAREKALEWLASNIDEQTKTQIRHLLESDEKELYESFYQNLEFGTGGLRGIMGPGTNRMNIYTVGMATQGFANYLKKSFVSMPVKVAIAYDSRNNSRLFSENTAKVFAANGFHVYLFESLRPTPELSFAIRNLGCQAGVVITASHNPKEYNGFKAYWNDGGQLVPPHDKNVISEVLKIKSIDEIKFDAPAGSIEVLGGDFDQVYLSKIKGLMLSPDAVKKHHDLKIVYTPLHGTGVRLVPMALKMFGFSNIITVKEQEVSDGNFPTVKSPNPEEKAALDMAMNMARKEDADLVMATDPDADRVGIAVRNHHGEFELLNGNQTATLLTYYILTRNSELGMLSGKEYIVKTIVTTELLAEIAKSFNVPYLDVLTGFKYIAEVILENENKKRYLCGGEESYGFLVGDFVRDKDAVSACAMVAECAAWAKEQGKTLFDILISLYTRYGLYRESLLSVTKKGSEGQKEIQDMMIAFRSNPPKTLAGSPVVEIRDYQSSTKTSSDGKSGLLEQPKSNVLQYLTADGSIVSVRPSGTEPKIKFYFGVKGVLTSGSEIDNAIKILDRKIGQIKSDLSLEK